MHTMLSGALLALLLMLPALSPAADQGPAPAGLPPAAAAGATRKLDLNRATLPEFIGVPGIGPQMAQAILDLRVSKGKFTKLEDLLEVKGIGEKKLAALVPYLSIPPAAPPVAAGQGNQPK